MRDGLTTRLLCLGSLLFVAACAGAPEPETPPQAVPTKQERRREPLPPAPSNTPEVVYAQNVLASEQPSSHVMTNW